MQTPKSVRRRLTKLTKKNIIVAAIVVLLAAAIGYLLWQNYQLRSPEGQQRATERANQSLIQEVSSKILLPSDQTPTIATITNVDELRKVNENFYKEAQNGDQILFYSTRAVIYRKGDGKIINVAPVTLNPSDQKGTDQAEE
ncbi:MAG: hypothetical protein V1895_01475 [Parcubacteria group bacterium]